MGMRQEIPVTPKAAINSFTQTMKFASQHLTKIHPSGRMMASAILSREESNLKRKRIWHQIWKDFYVTIHGERPVAAMLSMHSECRSCAQLMNWSSITFDCLILFIACITVFVFFPLSLVDFLVSYHLLRFGGKITLIDVFFWGPETDWPPFPKRGPFFEQGAGRDQRIQLWV